MVNLARLLGEEPGAGTQLERVREAVRLLERVVAIAKRHRDLYKQVWSKGQFNVEDLKQEIVTYKQKLDELNAAGAGGDGGERASSSSSSSS